MLEECHGGIQIHYHGRVQSVRETGYDRTQSISFSAVAIRFLEVEVEPFVELEPLPDTIEEMTQRVDRLTKKIHEAKAAMEDKSASG